MCIRPVHQANDCTIEDKRGSPSEQRRLPFPGIRPLPAAALPIWMGVLPVAPCHPAGAACACGSGACTDQGGSAHVILQLLHRLVNNLQCTLSVLTFPGKVSILGNGTNMLSTGSWLSNLPLYMVVHRYPFSDHATHSAWSRDTAEQRIPLLLPDDP